MKTTDVNMFQVIDRENHLGKEITFKENKGIKQKQPRIWDGVKRKTPQ